MGKKNAHEKSIDPNHSFFCSFHIVSLYTNVPLDETIANCADTLYCSHLDPLSYSGTFLKLIHIATKRVEFSFNNTMYQLTDGISMECPPRNHQLATVLLMVHWWHLFSSRSESRRFFYTVNQKHPALTFTCEFAHNNSLPFLDVLVALTNFGMHTTIYRKPTFTGSYSR